MKNLIKQWVSVITPVGKIEDISITILKFLVCIFQFVRKLGSKMIQY